MAKIFEVYNGDDFTAFANQAEAKKFAREVAAHSGDDVTVNAVELVKLPAREMIAAALNGVGYSVGKPAVIYTAKPAKAQRKAAEPIDDGDGIA